MYQVGRNLEVTGGDLLTAGTQPQGGSGCRRGRPAGGAGGEQARCSGCVVRRASSTPRRAARVVPRGLQGSMCVFVFQQTQPAASATLPGTGFLLQSVSVHHHMLSSCYQPSTDWHPSYPWRTWSASWNLYSRVRSSPGSTSSKYTCVCVQQHKSQQQQEGARQAAQQAVKRAPGGTRDTAPAAAACVVVPASSLSAHTLVSTQLVCAVQLLRWRQSSSCPPPLLPEPAAGLSHVPQELPTRCVKFWMYMLKSIGEFREATTAVRLYALVLSLCALITAVICGPGAGRAGSVSGRLGDQQDLVPDTPGLHSRCRLLGTAWWGAQGSRWPWSGLRGPGGCSAALLIAPWHLHTGKQPSEHPARLPDAQQRPTTAQPTCHEACKQQERCH